MKKTGSAPIEKCSVSLYPVVVISAAKGTSLKGGHSHEQVQKVRGVWRNRGGLGSGLIALHPSKGTPLSIERPTAAGSREGNAGSKRVPDRF